METPLQLMYSCRGSVAAYPINSRQQDMRNILSPSLTLHIATWKMTWQFAHRPQFKVVCFSRLCRPPKTISSNFQPWLSESKLVVIWHPDATVESHITVLTAITKRWTLHPILKKLFLKFSFLNSKKLSRHLKLPNYIQTTFWNVFCFTMS